MAKITWLGETECKWNDVVFPPGTPIETDDTYMISKARHNPFFKLEDAPTKSVFGPMPEMWTETAPEDAMAFEAMEPSAVPPKRKRGRPPKVRHNVDQ